MIFPAAELHRVVSFTMHFEQLVALREFIALLLFIPMAILENTQQ